MWNRNPCKVLRLLLSTSAVVVLALSTTHAFVPSTTKTTTRVWVSKPSSSIPPQDSSSLRRPFRHHPVSFQKREDVLLLRMSSEAAAAAPGEQPKGGGEATIPQEIFNLVKGIVGAGVLSLPAGIASFGNSPTAALPAAALVTVIGILSAYGFILIGRSCNFAGTTSFRDTWSATVSKETSWIPAFCITFKTICAVLAYSMILGDTFAGLLHSFAGLSVSSTTTLLSLTGLVLLPLCLLKNLSSLAPFSLLGSLGMIYTAVAMAIRYFGKAYMTGGKFANDLPVALKPSFGSVGAKGVLSPSAAILVGMLSTAYMAHFNAPKFYVELKDNTIPRFTKVVATSFGISIGLFGVMAALGFLTFGGSCSGVILNNYSGKDALMNLSKVAVALSLVFSYPLAFTGARDGILDLFNFKDRSSKTQNILTCGLLSVVTVMALIIPDVSFVLSFAGATMGNALIYVFPALMFRGSVKKMSNASRSLKREAKAAMASAALGIVMGLMGATMAVKSLF